LSECDLFWLEYSNSINYGNSSSKWYINVVMASSNQNVADLLRSVAAAITLKKGNLFQIRAYENAADSIEHLTSEIKDLWEEDKLDQVPGIGTNLQIYLGELFKTGDVKHFQSILKHFPEIIYELIKVPGIGPKTALELANLGIKTTNDLIKKINSGEIVEKGFSEKIAQKIRKGLLEFNNRSGRMLLPYAFSQAQKILEYLKKSPNVIQADPLGSLRRQVATIGDLDFAASSKNPEKVVKYLTKMPGVSQILGEGENKATVVLGSGLHIDLLVGHPETYGALLQHFTGGKNHNIKLRTLALKKGLSISEYGVKKVSQDGKVSQVSRVEKIIPVKTEDELYKLLGMQTPPPEIREDSGEIELALEHKLPQLVELKDIKGDFHLHSNFPIDSSHDYGTASLEEIVKRATELRYKYVGLSDHSPSPGTHTKEEIVRLIEKRTKAIQRLQTKYKSIRVLNGLEIDILSDGTLAVPEEGLKMLDYSVVGIHSGHRSSKESITKRIISALKNPFASILAHPTGRLLNERESYEADWEEIFKLAAKNKKLLEINAYPNRLDLRDDLVKQALEFGVKFTIDTDSHALEQVNNMPFGVAVARRGWATTEDVANTWEWKKLSEWFNIKS